MRFGTVWFILAAAAALSGCNSSPTPTPSDGTGAASTTPKGAAHTGRLDRLKTIDKKVGTGDKAQVGDELSLSYVGTLADGTVFDSTEKEGGKPISVPLGAGKVIKGWDDGLVGMQQGGERELEIPAALGYGAQAKAGQGGQPGIPSNSDLYFDVKLLNLTTRAKQQQEQNSMAVSILSDPGKGPVIKKGDTLTVDYTCTGTDGTVADTTTGKKPESITLGKDTAMGVEIGILKAHVHEGSHLKITVPPQLGPHGPAFTPQVYTYDVYIRKVNAH